MDSLIHLVTDSYERLINSGDDRVRGWPLVQSPFPTLALCLTYGFVVKVAGPAFMQHREPLNIRWLMITYNLLMVLLSTWLFYNLGHYGWFNKYDYRCQPVDYSSSREAIGMAETAWYYYMTKFVEFADTFFFLARKKLDHISSLHVIHHGLMPMSVWWGMKYAPGGHSSFFGFINSFVHIPMYLYYGLSAIGPHMSKYLFWKKYMTSLQMVQFVAIFVHSFQLLFRDCDYPKEFVYWIGSHAILFWFLFWDFFKKTYLMKTTSKASTWTGDGQDHGKKKNGVATTNGPQFICSPTETLLHLINQEKADDEAAAAKAKAEKPHANGSVVNGSATKNGSLKSKPNVRNNKKKE